MWPAVYRQPPGPLLLPYLQRPGQGERAAAQAGAGGLGRLAHLDRLDHRHAGAGHPAGPGPRLNGKSYACAAMAVLASVLLNFANLYPGRGGPTGAPPPGPPP
jgi:hypothetical protein